MLEVLGLTADAQNLYRRLLGVSALMLTDDHQFSADAIAELAGVGLAVRLPAADPDEVDAPDQRRLVATSPDDALARLLMSQEKQLNERQERLQEVRRGLAGLRTAFHNGRGDARPTGLVEVIVGREAVNAAHRAVHQAAVRQMSICDTGHFDVPVATAAVIVPEPALLDSGVVYRTVYDRSIFDVDPEAGAITLSESLAGGEIQRLVPELPLKFVLADETLALVALTKTGTDSALLVRAEPLLAVLRMYFESLWMGAVPLGGEPEDTLPQQKYGALPRLLATGLSDEAVAQQMGTSVRTVRRRVAQMMDDLGAVSRFQAGVLAERDGLLRPAIDVTGSPAFELTSDYIDLRDRACSSQSG